MDKSELKHKENPPEPKEVPCFLRKQVREKLLSQLGSEAPKWAEKYGLSDQHLENLLKTQENLYEAVSQLKVFQGFPKTELWRLFMDGKDHDRGILGFENERGYMGGMMRGFIQVVETLNERLDHKSYERLHDICTGNVRDKVGELLTSSYYCQSMNFCISDNNWSEEGYQELQKKYDDGHVVGRNLSSNPKDRLSPSQVAEKMRLHDNLKEAERISKEILQIRKDNRFDPRIEELKTQIQEIARDSGVVDPVKASFDSNINKIRQEMDKKEVRYFRKDIAVGKLKMDVQATLDEYHIKIDTIDKNKEELKEVLKNEKVNKYLQEVNSNELDKNDIITYLRKIQELKEIIDKCDRNINYIEKQIELLDNGNANTLSERDRKLAAVVECCQNLDQLHAFADGNVRTATLVLNKFLIELGEYPCIFNNPNVLDVKSIRELMQYTREGQERFKSYIIPTGIQR
jgi:hypothetical protein